MTKFKNNSNGNEIISQFNKKEREKTSETQNHFFSIRNKYKKLALLKENSIKKNLTKMQLEPEKKENKINNKIIRSKSFKINEDDKYNSLYKERNKKSSRLKDQNVNKIKYFQNEKGNEEKDFKYAYPRNTVKLHKLKKGLLPYNSYSKYNNNLTFNKNNRTTYDANYKKHIVYHSNSNIMKVAEASHKPNKSIDLNSEVPNDYNKISYIYNSNNVKKKSITYFNIRVINNKAEENDLNKLNKNNAFYLSKYSRYNPDY